MYSPPPNGETYDNLDGNMGSAYFELADSKKKCELQVDVPVQFIVSAPADQKGGDPMQRKAQNPIARRIDRKKAAIIQASKTAVTDAWDNKFKLCCRCDNGSACKDGVAIRVSLVTRNGGDKHDVRLWGSPPNFRSGQFEWNAEDPKNAISDIARHEVGDMLGNPDEYDPVTGTPRGNQSIMDDNKNGQAQAGHFEVIGRWAGHNKRLNTPLTNCQIVPIREACSPW